MGAPVKKQFDYYVTNLDWNDGSDLEYVDKPKLFDRSFNFEHTYTMPGFYAIKGLVFKHALMMKSIYPPKTTDFTQEWLVENYTIVTENWENYDANYPAVIKRIRTKENEERYIRLAGYNVADDEPHGPGTDNSGLQWSPSSAEPDGGFYIAAPTNSYTNIRIYSEQPSPPDKSYRGTPESEFVGAIEVKVPSTGGSSDGPLVLANETISEGWCGTRTQNAGARMHVNVHMDADNNSFFQFKFDAWLPNFGRYTTAAQSSAPSISYDWPSYEPQEFFQPTVANALSREPTISGRQSRHDIKNYYGLSDDELDDILLPPDSMGGDGELEWVGKKSSDFNIHGLDKDDSGVWKVTNASDDQGDIAWDLNLSWGGWNWRDGTISQDGLWVWRKQEQPNGTEFAGWLFRETIISEDQQWMNNDGGDWILNPDFDPNIERDPVNNPTRYRIKLRAVEPNYDDDGNEIYNSPDWSTGQDDYWYIKGTNSWQTFQGNFFAQKKYVRLFIEITQRDGEKDFDPRVSSTTSLDVDGNSINMIEQYGHRWWRFFLRNIEMRFQNNNDLKFPLEWEKFQSNMVINPSPTYASPFFYKNNFLMIGGLTKKSFYFKSLASILGYDYNSLERKENFNYDAFNQYDVMTGLDTLAKFEKSMYNNYLDSFSEVIEDNYGEVINKGIIDKDWHGVFENTGLTETDIATTRIYKGVKPMWQQLGFSAESYDNPDESKYWKNIIPKDFDLSNRSGITKRDLPDPTKGSLTPRIPRQEFIVDEDVHQYWEDGYFWPNLSKFNKLGVFNGEYPGGRFSNSASFDDAGTMNITPIPFAYGDEKSDIMSMNISDTKLSFDIIYDDEQIQDTTDNFDIKYITDFSLKVDDNNRINRKVVDHTDLIEKNNKEQAF